MSHWNKTEEQIKFERLAKESVMDNNPLLFRNHRRPGDNFLYGLSVGMGWIPMIEEMSAKIEKIINDNLDKDPEFKIPSAVQVKEKFGTLRFYVDNSNKEIDKIIDEYELKSEFICEECGNEGSLRRKGWYKVLCNSCDEKRQ